MDFLKYCIDGSAAHTVSVKRQRAEEKEMHLLLEADIARGKYTSSRYSLSVMDKFKESVPTPPSKSKKHILLASSVPEVYSQRN